MFSKAIPIVTVKALSTDSFEGKKICNIATTMSGLISAGSFFLIK